MAGGKTVAAGTPGYTPLEQWQMQPSPKSDVYALGATMHHLLTARDPRDRFVSFPELDLELLRSLSEFGSLLELRPDVTQGLSGLIGRCLEVDPKRRPTAQQVKIELTKLAPSGSRFFQAVKRWSPTLGEVLGTAMVTFVRALFGRPAPSVEKARNTHAPAPEKRTHSQRPSIPCLYCRGNGVTGSGRPCPICRGSGYW